MQNIEDIFILNNTGVFVMMDNFAIMSIYRHEQIIEDCFLTAWLINYKQMDICT